MRKKEIRLKRAAVLYGTVDETATAYFWKKLLEVIKKDKGQAGELGAEIVRAMKLQDETVEE